MAERLLARYKTDPNRPIDYDRLSHVLQTPKEYAQNDWLMTWYGAAMCGTPTLARAELSEFKVWLAAQADG